MIVAEQLTKRFEHYLAVAGVSFTVQPGQVLVFLGPNGAGKTTTVRMLSSMLRPTSGSASVAGFDVEHQPDEVRARVGVLTEQHGLYGRMTAGEYLQFFGSLYRLDATTIRTQTTSMLEQFGLADARDKRLSTYSKGMRQKLALQGWQAVGSSPEGLKNRIDADVKALGTIIKDQNIRAQ